MNFNWGPSRAVLSIFGKGPLENQGPNFLGAILPTLNLEVLRTVLPEQRLARLLSWGYPSKPRT